jgi:2-polyprenyl-6-methoxyphenol hydroxylase-like FAD-dependent oxidoreductase
MRSPDVLVVGAGPVGMFTALSLARAGIAVEVIDEAGRRAGHSYAVGLHPRSVLLADQLGLLERVLPVGQRVDGVMLQGAYEERWVELAGLPGGAGFGLAVPQHQLEAALEAELDRRGVTVHWNARLAALDPAEERPAATVDQLVRDSSGYAFAANVTVVGRRRVLHPRFVIGADGHQSTVARQLGVVDRRRLPSQTFAAFEVHHGGDIRRHDVQLVLGNDGVDAIWPLRDGWSRCTFEVSERQIAEASREKDRATWWISDAEAKERLSELLAERAPWLPAPAEIGWSGMARFERRVAAAWGRRGVWLLGDAAHVASPLASHSLNRGLHEADALAATIAAVIGGGAGVDALPAWAERSCAEWDWVFSTRLHSADPWLGPHAGKLLQALPATGDALRELVARLDLRFERGDPAARRPLPCVMPS